MYKRYPWFIYFSILVRSVYKNYIPHKHPHYIVSVRVWLIFWRTTIQLTAVMTAGDIDYLALIYRNKQHKLS